MSFVGARVNVRGLVQGVGFRYYCLMRSRNYNIAGYVANLHDRSVEIEVEGDRGEIEEFLKEVKIGPTNSNVTDLSIEWYNHPKQHEIFTIKHY